MTDFLGSGVTWGQVWMPSQPLNTNAATDTANDIGISLATDHTGAWVAVWHESDPYGGSFNRDVDILSATSLDNGASWDTPKFVNPNPLFDSRDDAYPRIATDDAGTWVTVWHSSGGGSADPFGTDVDIFSARSTDRGATWGQRIPVNPNAATDNTSGDFSPVVAADRTGRWVTAWESGVGPTFSLWVIKAAVSIDGGSTWSPPAVMIPQSAGRNFTPDIATDDQGTWMIAWYVEGSGSTSIGSDGDIMVARSVDGGTTWNTPRPVNANATSDTAIDFGPSIATDGHGVWAVVWSSVIGTVEISGRRRDIVTVLVSRSTDNGATWSVPASLDPDAMPDVADDDELRLATDGGANWIATWRRSMPSTASTNSDYEVDAARSADGGVTWERPVPIQSSAVFNAVVDVRPEVATDRAGTWLAAWAAFGAPTGGQHDQDIMFVRGALCADGLLGASEQCDDANSTPQDGCDGTCQVEAGFDCTGQPSVCALLPSATPTPTATVTTTAIDTPSPPPTVTPTTSATSTVSATATATPSPTGTSTVTLTPTATPTSTETPSVTQTAIVTETPSTSPTATPVGVDHFTCYKAGATRGSVRFPGIPIPPGVGLLDQYGASTVAVRKPVVLCAPTNTLGEDPGIPIHPEHLVGFQIKNPTPAEFPMHVEIVDQFSPRGLFVDLRKQSHLLVPTAKNLRGTPPTPGMFMTDHFECYKVAVSSGSTKFVAVPGVTVQDQFGTMRVNVTQPQYLCTPVDKNGEDPTAPSHVTHLMCYQVKQVDPLPFMKIIGIFVNNQFGPEQLDVKKPSNLCVPALRTP